MLRKLKLIDRGHIKDLPTFLENLENLKEIHAKTQLWFRGHSSRDYELKPSCARTHNYAGKSMAGFSPEVERKLLDRFSRYAFTLLGRVSGEWETLFVARHYGLPVRLLDWTSSPLTALYFACCDPTPPKVDPNGTLWALSHWGPTALDWNTLTLMKGDDEKTGPFTKYVGRKGKIRTAIKLIPSLFNSPRIVAQQGWFTYHSQPQIAIEDCVDHTYPEEDLDFRYLVRWGIPDANKPQLIAQLHSVGVARRVLFPDLDGIARGIWESQVLWRSTGELR